MKYKVGDKVRVRKWKDMEKQFGLRPSGSIDCRCGFVLGMAKYCGKIVTISSDCDIYRIKEDGHWYGWSDDMFEGIVDGNKLISKFFFKGNKTIYYDKDGKRTVVKCCEDDTYDKKMGVLFVIAKANGYTWRDIEKICNEQKDKKTNDDWLEEGATYVCIKPFTNLSYSWKKNDKVTYKSHTWGSLMVYKLGEPLPTFVEESAFRENMIKV